MAMTAPLNVLFITADQWRGECLSTLGHPCLRTPVLDALAAEGVVFTRHYSQAAPCAPGRASLYTGLYQMNHRCVVNGAPLDARHTNVALEARKAGHDPVLFGYTDVTPDPRRLHAEGLTHASLVSREHEARHQEEHLLLFDDLGSPEPGPLRG